MDNILHMPVGKDQMRIYNMVLDATPGGRGKNFVARPSMADMPKLLAAGRLMNSKIKSEEKRILRREAALHYGLYDLARVFA